MSEAISSVVFMVAAWSAGIGAAGAVVVASGTASRGFRMLVASVAAGLALFLVPISPWFLLPVGFYLLVPFDLPTPVPAASLLAAAVATSVAADPDSWPTMLVIAVMVGFVTTEMLLGHWYLVQPTLPRSILLILASVALVGVGGVVIALLADPPTSPLPLILTGTTALLTMAVIASLRRPGYQAVMAATGLAYLGTLTSLGAAGSSLLVQ